MSMQPYPGLRPYEEDERRNFFGREADSKILIDQILANRLTLLFAATGVGKSSLLKASVIPRLKEPLGENLDVVYYNDWVVSPLPSLKPVILNTLHEEGDLEKDVVDEDVREGKLPEFLEFCCLFASQPFVIVLDQFEEFFRYRNNYPKEEFQAFIDQLTDVVLNKAIPVAVVLSMREDYALELNAFKPKLPMILFENYYRLEKLTREAAKEAILTPVERIGFKYEPVLFEMLLKDLLSRELDRSKGSMVAETIETVEPPYLQIICSQLWERDQNDPQKTIRFATYEKAGYAKGLLDNYIEKDVLSKFSFQEKQLSSKAFDHLVSRRGTKMPHTVEDLAQTVDVKPDDLQKVLEKLAKNRILRSQQREEKIWYELYHDMFSHSIDDWNTVWKNKMRARRSVIGIGLATLACGVIFIGYDTFVNYRHTHLRMSLSDPYSMVELWQGEKGSLDVFDQQKFLAQIDVQVKDREPDKRLPRLPVSENNNLVGEWVGALPLKRRVTAFSSSGQFKKALTVAKASISDTDTGLSREMSASLGQIYTASASDLLFEVLRYIGNGDLNAVIRGELSVDRLAFWLKDSGAIETKLVSGTAQQKIALINNLIWLTFDQGRLVAILERYLKDNDSSVRSSAARALGQLDGVESLPALVTHLKDNDSGVRSNVVQALGQIGSIEALPALIEQLKDNDSDVRSNVISALGQLGSVEALPALIEQLKDDNPDVRSKVVSVLGRLGGVEALPALLTKLKDENSAVRSSVVKVLGELDHDQALLALIRQLKDQDSEVRNNVVSALSQLGNVEALSALIEQLKDDNPGVRSNVASALGQLGSEEALPALVAQLQDGNPDVRSSVAFALGQLGSVDALSALIEHLKKDNPGVRSSVAFALGQLGNVEALPALVAQLQDDNSDVRSSVASALGQLGNVDALPALVEQLQDDNAYVRSNVASALGQLGSLEASPALVARLQDERWNVRSSVASALGQLGSLEALPVLVAQLQDDSSDVRSSAARALGQLGSLEALPVLVAQLQDDSSDVRSNVASALGQLGSLEALPALVARLQDDSIVVRSNVASALGQLGSEEALPALLEQLRDVNYDVRSSVARALGQLGKIEALPMLVSQLQNERWEVRCNVASALGQLGSEEALSVLITQLKDDDYDVRSNVARALGQLGSEEALPMLVTKLQDERWNVRSSVASALGQLGNVEALPALRVLFEHEHSSNFVKAAAASALVVFDDNRGIDSLLLGIKDSVESVVEWDIQSGEENITLQQSIFNILSRVPAKNSRKLLLKQFDSNLPVSVQRQWIEAFSSSDMAEALPLLYNLSDSNNGMLGMAAWKAIAMLEGNKAKLLQMTENQKLPIPIRMQALVTFTKKHRQAAIPDLLRLLEADEKFYAHKIWPILDELKVFEVKGLLEKRIEEIRQGYANWRDIRDSEPMVAEEEIKEQNVKWKKWKEKLDAGKPPYAAHYARTLTRIDPEKGLELLSHEIADIRTGAWYGLASLGDVSLVKKLTDLRLNSKDDPLLRHAAYRAIDLSLTTIQHNNKPEDLEVLRKWYPDLKRMEMQKEEVKSEDELSITPRVDWTINLIDYNLKAKAELHRRYEEFVAKQKKEANQPVP